ncbi:MAG TPA: hypothetical protein VE378_03930, partial [Nitrososphaeraceae archaeon]|nr:hypothetical protein [Nitrososphaeraceae archaeon]
MSIKGSVVERVIGGLESPTGISFVGPNDILVIEKNRGTVLRIVNGEILPEPLLRLNVANEVERGLLGIAVSNSSSGAKNYVFLFYTEAEGEIGEGREEKDNGNGDQRNGGIDRSEPLGNRLYRYEFSADGTKLVNPKLLLDLPYEPGPAHNGG